eukprot:bmy_13497T0
MKAKNSSILFTPDFRWETLRHGKMMERPRQISITKKKGKPLRTLITKVGKALKLNEPKLDFS